MYAFVDNFMGMGRTGAPACAPSLAIVVNVGKGAHIGAPLHAHHRKQLRIIPFFFVSLQINYGKGRACPAPTK